MEYTRQQFITLLEKHFSKVLHTGGRYQLEEHDNKEVAGALDYSEKQFGACLNPSEKTNYKTVVRRLMTLDKLRELEGRCVELVEEKKALQKDNQSSKKINWILFVAVIFAGIIAILLGFWLPSRLDESIKAIDQTGIERFIVRTGPTVDAILSWHGKIVSNQLAWEAIILNAKVKNSETDFTDIQNKALIEEAKDIVRRVVKDERVGLTGLGFFSEDNRNIVEILDQIAPHDSLLQAQNPPFFSAFDRVGDLILSKETPYEIIADKVIKAVTEEQQKLWGRMRNEMGVNPE